MKRQARDDPSHPRVLWFRILRLGKRPSAHYRSILFVVLTGSAQDKRAVFWLQWTAVMAFSSTLLRIVVNSRFRWSIWMRSRRRSYRTFISRRRKASMSGLRSRQGKRKTGRICCTFRVGLKTRSGSFVLILRISHQSHLLRLVQIQTSKLRLSMLPVLGLLQTRPDITAIAPPFTQAGSLWRATGCSWRIILTTALVWLRTFRVLANSLESIYEEMLISSYIRTRSLWCLECPTVQ